MNFPEKKSQARPVVNVVTLIRQGAVYVAPFVAQITVQIQRNYELGTINIVHDGGTVITDESLMNFSLRGGVEVVPEMTADSSIGDIESKARQWAAIGNQGIESALSSPSSHILWIESDLCFPCDLIDQLVASDLDVVAPYIGLGSIFYDSWGFRDLEGKKIFQFPPQRGFRETPVELSSVGSCVLFRSDIFRDGVRFRGTYENGLLVGVCNDARALGYRVWMAPSVAVLHPTTLWRDQTWKITEVCVADQSGLVLDSRKVNGIVAGFYQNFIRGWLKSQPNMMSKIGGGVFELIVERDPVDREIRLRFVRLSDVGVNEKSDRVLVVRKYNHQIVRF